MARTIGSILRLALLLVGAGAIAACAPVEAPRLGSGPPALKMAQVRNLGSAPVKGPAATFAFVAVKGTPATRAFELEADLKKYAATRNLRLVPETEPGATYYIKGYLSAIGDSRGTLLVYVWDVYDSAGNPLHRISGQETAAGSVADPWSGISSGNVDAAARETIDKLADWVRG
jgi:hypothetical protein